MSKTDTINKIIKEFREKFVKSAFTDEQDAYYVQCDAQDLESFLTLSLEKAIQEAVEEEKWRIKKAILLIDDLEEAKKIIRKELKEKEKKA